MSMSVGVSLAMLFFHIILHFVPREYCNSKFLLEGDSDWCDLSQVSLLCPESCVQKSRPHGQVLTQQGF